MKHQKLIAALCVAGSLGVAGVASAGKNTNSEVTYADKKEQAVVDSCGLLSLGCAGTQGNGGGKVPDLPPVPTTEE